jgi:hypothetical protein
MLHKGEWIVLKPCDWQQGATYINKSSGSVARIANVLIFA